MFVCFEEGFASPSTDFRISCPVTCSNVSLQSVFPAIELTLTLEFFSLFQQLSLMTAAQNTVYVVLTFAIRKADLSFLPYSKHI